MSRSPPFDLDRFVKAQAGNYTTVLAELEAGQKRGAWMNGFFPQIRALDGTAEIGGIVSADEARAYLDHRLLGPRLLVCTRAVLAHKHRTVEAIFGVPDDAQFHASMTLFDRVNDDSDLFQRALERYWEGRAHERTIAFLDQAPAASAAGGGS